MGMTGSPVSALPQLGLPSTGAGQVPVNSLSNPAVPQVASNPVPSAAGIAPGVTPTTPGAVPQVGSVAGGIAPVASSSFDAVYGNDVGNAVDNLLNSESPNTANSLANQIIAANAPNVAQGSANLNTGLAASGISPSSSVSAIENANYQGQVAQQDQSELAQINLQEQQMQQSLLTSLLPDQKARETESSGWSIFGDVMSGLGDVAGIAGVL